MYLPIELQGFATEDLWILIIFAPFSRNFQQIDSKFVRDKLPITGPLLPWQL